MARYTEDALIELIRRVGIDWKKAIAVEDGTANLGHDFDITPERFLEFAKQDLEGDDDRALVNALTNAKRAIDAQIDKVLLSFGVRTDQLGIRRKTEFLQELGVATPRIIRKVRDARNYLEHEYKLPEREQVEDAVDVAVLFVAATEEALHDFPDYVLLSNVDAFEDQVLRFRDMLLSYFDQVDKQFIFRGFREAERIKDLEITITSADPLYPHILKLHMAVKREKGIKKAIAALRDVVVETREESADAS